MSAPQHPTEPVAPTSEATSGAVLSPPADADVPAQPDLPDADEDGADAAVEPADPAGDDEGADDLLVREGDVAGDYLERLLDILDVDGDIDLDVEGDRASVAS